MNLSEIIKALETARDRNAYGYIEVTIPGQQDTEFIVNRPESLNNKIEYYKQTYDENGVHNRSCHIRIVNAGIFTL